VPDGSNYSSSAYHHLPAATLALTEMGQTVSWLISTEGPPARLASQLATSLGGQRPRRYVPKEEDVLAAQAVLLEHLPIEIIHLILDEAEYWPRLLAQRESDPPVRVAASHSPTNIASHCYLVSPRIPESCLRHESRMKLRRVVFHVLSHDQGWGGDPGSIGTLVTRSRVPKTNSRLARALWWLMDLVRGIYHSGHQQRGAQDTRRDR
jgi:hypothetical protein